MLDFLASYFRFAKPDAKRPLRPIRDDEALMASILSLLSGDERGRLTPSKLTQIIGEADAGDPRRQAELFGVVQEKEPIIAAHLQTRRLAVLGCPMRFESESNPALAEEIDLMFRKAGLRRGISALMDAIGTGYAGCAVDWAPGGAAIRDIIPIAPSAWVFDEAGNPALSGVIAKPVPLADYHPAQIAYIISEGKVGLPCRKGLLRTLIWMYLFKNGGFRDWNLFLERFGVPFVLGKIPATDFTNDTLRAKLMESLLSIRSAGVGIGTTDTAMDILNGASGGNKDAFEQFQRYCDEIITLTILGQLASSDKAGGLSRGTAQDKVRQDLLEADCAMITEAVQKLATAYCQMRYGLPDAGDLEFVIDCAPPEDKKQEAEIFAILAGAARRPLDPEQVFERFGVRLGEPEPIPSIPMNANADTKEVNSKEDKSSLADFADVSNPEMTSARLINATLRRMLDTEAMEAWRIPIQREIKKAFGDIDPKSDTALDDFRDRAPAFLASLPGLMEAFDTGAFEKALQGAMLAGYVNGLIPIAGGKKK